MQGSCFLLIHLPCLLLREEFTGTLPPSEHQKVVTHNTSLQNISEIDLEGSAGLTLHKGREWMHLHVKILQQLERKA